MSFVFTVRASTNYATTGFSGHLFTVPDDEKKKPQVLHTEKVANCCGVNWIAGFPHPVQTNGGRYPDWKYDLDLDNNKSNRYNVDEDLKKILRLKRSDYGVTRAQINSLMMIVINHIQNAIYEDIILKHGFTLSHGPAYHDGHGHTLYVYSRNTHERTTPTADR